MTQRSLALMLSLGVVLSAAVTGQSPARPARSTNASKPWTPPRTPWGDPDLQGLWPATDMQGTPYERAESLAGRTALTDEEYAQRKADAQAQVRRGGWGERQANPSRQASLVVEPADGRIPPLTPE